LLLSRSRSARHSFDWLQPPASTACVGRFQYQLWLRFPRWRRPRSPALSSTFALALGKSFGENWSLRLTALNFTNHRFMLDNSNTFGGTHFVNPREISIQLRYGFHY